MARFIYQNSGCFPYKKGQVISKFTLSGEVIESEKEPRVRGLFFPFAYFSQFSRSRASSSSKGGERAFLLVEGAEVLAEKPGARDLQRQKGPCLQFPPGQGGGEDEHSQPRPGRLDQGGGADAFQKGLG